jgi:D-arabinose 1-dehydrogenase-like Zn-dependent alcohol dehydrogenase
MFFDGYSVRMSLVATRKVHDDMLEFAAHHSIVPTIEKFELSSVGVEAAFEKLKAGGMRYRGVLVAP